MHEQVCVCGGGGVLAPPWRYVPDSYVLLSNDYATLSVKREFAVENVDHVSDNK